uniref:Secreted protein n=1 Tax=Steinernema glaseri TaxID=37863 RepID=A0A1I8A9D0_9BILA
MLCSLVLILVFDSLLSAPLENGTAVAPESYLNDTAEPTGRPLCIVQAKLFNADRRAAVGHFQYSFERRVTSLKRVPGPLSMRTDRSLSRSMTMLLPSLLSLPPPTLSTPAIGVAPSTEKTMAAFRIDRSFR